MVKEEIWDLYDAWGKRSGLTIKLDAWVPEGYYLYCVGIWVIDSKNQILLTRRSMSKRYAPGLWENTGGHLLSGEESKEGIIRELWEETGIEITKEELIFLGTNRGGRFIGDNYAVRKDVALNEVQLEEGETCDVKKVSLTELEQMASAGELSPAVTDHLGEYIEKFHELFAF